MTSLRQLGANCRNALESTSQKRSAVPGPRSGNGTGAAGRSGKPAGIDKSVLPIGEARRYRGQGTLEVCGLAALPGLWAPALQSAPPPVRAGPGARPQAKR